MIQDRKSKKGAAAGLIFAAVVLVLVVLLENLSSLLPSVPAFSHPHLSGDSFNSLRPGGFRRPALFSRRYDFSCRCAGKYL